MDGGLHWKAVSKTGCFRSLGGVEGELEGISGSGMRTNIYCGGGIKVPCILIRTPVQCSWPSKCYNPCSHMVNTERVQGE